jgi:hypothetical protein
VSGAQPRFEADLERLLQERVHPDYRRDPQMRGVRVQYIRETHEGLFLSYNLIRRRNGMYHLGFAVMLAPHRPIRPCSPLAVGCLFDPESGLATQLITHLGRPLDSYPRYLWSWGIPQATTLEKMGPYADKPEQDLYPFYRSALTAGRPRMVRLLRCAATTLDRLRAKGLHRETKLPVLARAVGLEPSTLEDYRAVGRLDGLGLTRGRDIRLWTDEGRQEMHSDHVPDRVIVLHHLSAFRSVKVPLGAVIQRLMALKAVENDSENAPPIW